MEANNSTHQEKPTAAPEAGILGRIVVALGQVFAVGILLIALILVIEVILRYVFNKPTIWAHETVIFINATAFIFGGLYATARNAHIRVTIVYDLLVGQWRRWSDVLISLSCCVASITFAYAAWKGVKRAIFTPAGDLRLETTGSAWNPPTPGLTKLFLLAVLVVMALQFFILSISYFRKR
ncbi:MAG: TRAP transporter small permease [Sulfitobacter sp.]